VERNNDASVSFHGLAWLLFGCANRASLLYAREWNDLLAEYLYSGSSGRGGKSFRMSCAFSREEVNVRGEKLYIQDRIEENGIEIIERIMKGGHIYFCGLKGKLCLLTCWFISLLFFL
jgi:ferredoxin--NADP+ reductase